MLLLYSLCLLLDKLMSKLPRQKFELLGTQGWIWICSQSTFQLVLSDRCFPMCSVIVFGFDYSYSELKQHWMNCYHCVRSTSHDQSSQLWCVRRTVNRPLNIIDAAGSCIVIVQSPSLFVCRLTLCSFTRGRLLVLFQPLTLTMQP